MRHFLPRAEWLEELNDTLSRRNSSTVLDFDAHFVLVEEQWALGAEPEDVAEAIANGTHPRFPATKTA